MSIQANPIKTAIYNDLLALQTAGTLKAVVMEDLSKDALEGDYPAFPCAILGMSQVDTSTMDDTANNLRTYTFPILVLQKYENLDKATDMEDLRDALLNKFDTDFTLGGAAIGAIEPASSAAASASSGDKTYAYFIVTIKAKTLYQLGT